MPRHAELTAEGLGDSLLALFDMVRRKSWLLNHLDREEPEYKAVLARQGLEFTVLLLKVAVQAMDILSKYDEAEADFTSMHADSNTPLDARLRDFVDDVVAEALRHVVLWLSGRLLGLLLAVWSLRVCVCHIYNIQHTACSPAAFHSPLPPPRPSPPRPHPSRPNAPPTPTHSHTPHTHTHTHTHTHHSCRDLLFQCLLQKRAVV
jgi:hypothetical protein